MMQRCILDSSLRENIPCGRCMVEICCKNGFIGCFVNNSSMWIVEDDFAAVFDESAAAEERVWHMFNNSGAGGCWRELVKWDSSSFNLVHCNRASVPYASLFTSIVVTSRGIDLPRVYEVARVEDGVAVWTGDCL